MRKFVAEKLADHIADWGHRGLINDELFSVLQKRYSTDITLGRILLRWLGFLAVFMLGMSILGFVGMTLGAAVQFVAPILLSVLAYFMWIKGVQMAIDPEQHYPMSGAILVTVGLLAGFGALLALHTLFYASPMGEFIPYMMLVIGAMAFFTAYRYGLRWPLTLGVLLIFHGLGNVHSYAGNGSYFLGVQDERLTLIIGLASIIGGMWHEKVIEKDLDRREVGFGQIYIIFGLFYANVCLWFLSLSTNHLTPVLIFSAAGVTQIVLGGRLHDGRLLGFGIVFLSINIYTRMFENFWDDLSKGMFFLISGAFALAVGIVLERRSQKIKEKLT